MNKEKNKIIVPITLIKTVKPNSNIKPNSTIKPKNIRLNSITKKPNLKTILEEDEK